MGYRRVAALVVLALVTAVGQGAAEGLRLGSSKGNPMEQVLPPWTPVKAKADKTGVEVGVWGRAYRFANAPLPTSVVTAGEEVLAAPVRLVAQVAGNAVEWKQSGAFVLSQSPAEAVVSGWQRSDVLIVNAATRIEFDGMMRVDLVVMPQGGASPKLERLWLEVPLKRQRAGLFHYWPGGWGSAKNSGAVPESGMPMPFRPFIWLGWEEGGLGWFTESDKGWQPQDPKQPIEVVGSAEQAVLRFHLLDSPPPRLPLTYTMGFQATPVKPWPKDFHEWRICHGAAYGIESKPSKARADKALLDRAAELGVKTLVFHEHWTPIQNYPVTTQEAELKRLVSACHRRGIKLLLYFGYELSSLAPEWGAMSDEVLVKSAGGGLAGGYHRQPEQRDYIVCYNSRWQDILVEGIAGALDRYGFDGVYLDGTIEPWACANERHGCGYRAADGSLHPTYPIFAVRQLMGRLYALIHPRGGFVNAHQSTCCVTPTLAFAHSYWDGEQFGGGELAGDPLQKLPLATFRAEFMGRNFGVPAEYLVYERPPNWTFDHALAFTMLHDVRVRPGSIGAPLEKMSAIWDVMTRFGVSEAEWHPYWANGDSVAAQPDSVKVTFYARRGRGGRASRLLLVVSNLSPQQEATARVHLDLRRLGLRDRGAVARDALTSEALSMDANRLAVPLPPMRMRLVWVE
jgi:hypothetical protein